MTLFRKAEGALTSSDVVTIVGAEAYFHGAMTVRGGSVRIEGRVEGDVLEAQTVVIGATGRVQGNVCAEVVVVGGQVTGDIVASAALEIKDGGRVAGNIRTAKLFIEPGAVFDGTCTMSETEPESRRYPEREAVGEAS